LRINEKFHGKLSHLGLENPLSPVVLIFFGSRSMVALGTFKHFLTQIMK